MEWIDVLKRIERGENRHTEFKRGATNFTAVGKAVCAFANTEGGIIIIGVDDSGSIVGVHESPERLQERLTSFLQSGCSTPVSARVSWQEDPNGRVHWIEVPRLRGYEPLRYDGRVYVRRERSNVEPSPSELQELYNVFGFVITEEQAISAAAVDDIDLDSFRTYLHRLGLDTDEEPQPGATEDLFNRGVVTELDGRRCPTLYGLMGFGKEPQRFPPTDNLRIECVAYAGADRADDVLIVGDAKGRLDEQVNHAVGWVRSLAKFEHYDGLIRTDAPLVPLKALREVIVNAVAHRDYAIIGSKILLEVFWDRVVVTNPGTLPNHMTVESARSGGHPRSRNELMANFLLVSGLMEQRGRGWPIIRREMREFNSTDAELSQDRDSKFVRVTLQTRAGE